MKQPKKVKFIEAKRQKKIEVHCPYCDANLGVIVQWNSLTIRIKKIEHYE